MNRDAVRLAAALLIGILMGLALNSFVEVSLNPVRETTSTTTLRITTTVTSTISLTAKVTSTTITSTTTSRTTVTNSTTVTITEVAADQGFMLLSTGFRTGGIIPTEYTCDGANVSPPLSWSTPPEGTESLVLIMDDPDAPMGVFTHWVRFNLPKDGAELPEGASTEGGGVDGRNGMGRQGYFGPCPPRGPAHTYRFRLYAVDVTLTLDAGASKEEVLRAIEGHILAQAELTGRYGR